MAKFVLNNRIEIVVKLQLLLLNKIKAILVVPTTHFGNSVTIEKAI